MNSVDHLEKAAASQSEAFLQLLDEAFRRFGVPDGLPEILRKAVEATPRHRFVHRFRLDVGEPVQDFDADPIALLPVIYRGQPLTHVDADGSSLPSTNSEAAYVLWLLSRLGVEAGQRVLEIGSGSGWLLGIIAYLVEASGSATGVEIISSLADQARADVDRLGRGNAKVITADATRDPIPGGPFDRIIITAAVWDLPDGVFASVADGGQLLAPLRLPRDEGCQVTLLRREGRRFVTLWTSPGSFVPLVGAGQRAEVARVRSNELSFGEGAAGEPSLSYPLWFGGLDRNQPAPATLAFRRFLALTEPTFSLFEVKDAGSERARWMSDFGLLDKDASSAAVVRPGVIAGYGVPFAAAQLLRSYRRWCELGMPGPGAYSLEVQPAASQVATDDEPFLKEVRGDSTLIRRIDLRAGAWRNVIDEANKTSAQQAEAQEAIDS